MCCRGGASQQFMKCVEASGYPYANMAGAVLVSSPVLFHGSVRVTRPPHAS